MQPPDSPEVLRLQGFLRRNGQPHHVVDATREDDAAALLEQYGAAVAEPIVVCPVGGAIGEGAAAVALIHQYLAAPRPAPTGTTIYGE